jgi:hypothetical protein
VDLERRSHAPLSVGVAIQGLADGLALVDQHPQRHPRVVFLVPAPIHDLASL